MSMSGVDDEVGRKIGRNQAVGERTDGECGGVEEVCGGGEVDSGHRERGESVDGPDGDMRCE